MSIKQLLDNYLEQEYEAYVAERKAEYLHSKAAATAISLRLAKQKQQQQLLAN